MFRTVGQVVDDNAPNPKLVLQVGIQRSSTDKRPGPDAAVDGFLERGVVPHLGKILFAGQKPGEGDALLYGLVDNGLDLGGDVHVRGKV